MQGMTLGCIRFLGIALLHFNSKREVHIASYYELHGFWSVFHNVEQLDFTFWSPHVAVGLLHIARGAQQGLLSVGGESYCLHCYGNPLWRKGDVEF